jgi:acetyl esterase/lipase
MGSVRSHRGLGFRIARAAKAKLLMLDYRLAPEHPFPAALEDAESAYEQLLKWVKDPGKIVVAGDSAGGNLAISSLVSLRDKGVPMPAAAVLISPWLDLKLTGRSMEENAAKDYVVHVDRLEEKVLAYLGDTDPENPLASPIRADLRGLPSLLILVGSTEVLLDDSKNLEKKALADKVEVDLRVWENMVHAWPFFAPILPEGKQAIELIGRFIRKKRECLNG